MRRSPQKFDGFMITVSLLSIYLTSRNANTFHFFSLYLFTVIAALKENKLIAHFQERFGIKE